MLDGQPFNTHATYYSLHAANSSTDSDFIWHSRVPNKVKIFAWLVQFDRLNTRANLHHKTIIDYADCPICPVVAKDDSHLFFECPATRAFWNKAEIFLYLLYFNDLWKHQSSTLPPAIVWPTIAILMMRKIWNSRNAKIFRNKVHTPPKLSPL
jgi:hypothetical protein